MVFEKLIECLYEADIWCHHQDKIIDSDETVMLTNAVDMQEEAAGILPFCVISIEAHG